MRDCLAACLRGRRGAEPSVPDGPGRGHRRRRPRQQHGSRHAGGGRQARRTRRARRGRRARRALTGRHRSSAEDGGDDPGVHRRWCCRAAVRDPVSADGERGRPGGGALPGAVGGRAGGGRQGCAGAGEGGTRRQDHGRRPSAGGGGAERRRRVGALSGRRPATCGRGRGAGHEGNHPAGGPQRPRQLPGRAERRASGSRGDLFVALDGSGRGGIGPRRASRTPRDIAVVGLVLVCHSAKLAEGVAELAAQMGGAGLRIGVAGGLDQPGNPLGTDAARVARAVEDVWSEDGVLVLMDLGSAVLSAEMALDLLPEERRDHVVLTEAPLVEGAVAAAVAAGLGDSLEKVAEEARGALAAKASHLTPQAALEPLRGTPLAEEGSAQAGTAEAARGPTLRLTVESASGLHARPAATLVRTAAGFNADVTISNATTDRGPASARSLNAVATLGVRHGDEILVRACGPQAEEALAAIRRLADDDFGDPREARPQAAAGAQTGRSLPVEVGAAPLSGPPPAPGSVLTGLPGSPGVAVGKARRLRAAPVEAPDGPSEDRDADWDALERALSATAHDIRRARASVASRASDYDAAIFDAHLLFLEDEALLGPARGGVMRDGKNAARAWADAVAAAAAAWQALDDPYQRARAADLRSVGDQVLYHLLDLPADFGPRVASFDAGAAGIVVALDLTPAEAAGLDPAHVLGVACAFGGPTSHAAILARSLGIPAVVGVGRALLGVAEGTLLALDGEAGTVTVDPPAAAVRAAGDRRERRAREEAEAQTRAHLPAVTCDGAVVHVAANVAGPGDVRAVASHGRQMS